MQRVQPRLKVLEPVRVDELSELHHLRDSIQCCSLDTASTAAIELQKHELSITCRDKL